MKTNKIFLPVLLCTISSNADAINYRTGNWNFLLDADGMVGFLEPKDDRVLFINDWDVKGQISYNSTRIYIDVFGENGSFEGYILWKIENNLKEKKVHLKYWEIHLIFQKGVGVGIKPHLLRI